MERRPLRRRRARRGINGQLSPKVWKLTKRTLQPGQVLPIAKTVSFQPVPTRTLYAGEHAIQPKMNGKLFERVGFVLR